MDVKFLRAWIRICAAGVLCAVAALSFSAGGYSMYRPGPQGVLHVRQPVLQWRISPTGGAKITSTEMSVNGERVKARYSASDGALLYRPDKPFSPGRYSVQCAVELDGRWKAEQKWDFTVAENAWEVLPEPTALQLEGLNAANSIRRKLGLPDFQMNASLCAAAQSHARFMRVNQAFGHYEQDGMPEFAGVKPIDRAQGFGHGGGVWENVAMCRTDPAGFVRQLFNAPYHRVPYMQPGAIAFGSGFDGRFSCLDFGASDTEGLVVSPASDETDVPFSWDGIESPSPLAVHGADGSVGYPIVFAWFGGENEGITLGSARLSGPSGEIPVYVNSPANDKQLKNAVLLIPRKPLAKAANYEVEVTARTASGKRLSKVWRFTTGM